MLRRPQASRRLWMRQKKLFLFAVIGWLLLLLYLLLFQMREKRNLGVMRSVGAQPRQLRRSLFLSGLILAGIGFIIGVCLSSALTGVVQEKLLSIALADVQASAHSGGMAINGASLAAMLDQGRLTPWGTWRCPARRRSRSRASASGSMRHGHKRRVACGNARSGPADPLGDMALPGAAQIALAGVCLWLHAAWRARGLLGV